MPKDYTTMENSNASPNADIHSVSVPKRRVILQAGVAALGAGLLNALAGRALAASGAASNLSAASPLATPFTSVLSSFSPTFKAIAPSMADAVLVPEGYTATPFALWGEPVGIAGNMPAFKPDASNTAAEQAVQMGMHHDGMHFYPFQGAAAHGLLVINHEYTDDGLLHTDGTAQWSAEKVRKSQAAHGISVIEIKQSSSGTWDMVRPSRFARRFTSFSPFAMRGPAAGHALLQTATDPTGLTVLGTLNNCASGMTPWGTYLSGEENFRFYFAAGDAPTAHHARWGLPKKSLYQWEAFDERWNAALHPNEPNRFGWIVEIDPQDPSSTPVKRTAIGRGAHEGAWVAVTGDQRAVVYSGEDARFEYIYKFVSRDRIKPAGGGLSAAQANKALLDHGTLYVARFDADGTGQWLPLVHGHKGLNAANGFADQGEVLIKARQASDYLGATKMDRPEWLTIDAAKAEIYCTLTNNSTRGVGKNPAVDAANPRANNTMGNIIKWTEGPASSSAAPLSSHAVTKGRDFDAVVFTWTHFVMAGDPVNARDEAKGNIKGDLFGCPDGITIAPNGVLWVQTDAFATELNKGEFKHMGNNQMLAYDPSTGAFKRFLAGPVNCEITGLAFTPDSKTMFVNIQHPGESAGEKSDPAEPMKFSNWPEGKAASRPRSATVIVQREDGGVVGS
jgi:uncharacterized protein